MTFSKEIIEVLEYLCTKLGVTIDWTAENVGPYLQDLCTKIVNYEFWTSLAWIGIVLLPLIFLMILAFRNSDLWELFVPLAALAVMVIGIQLFDIIECKVFPEKTIYEFISNILNN